MVHQSIDHGGRQGIIDVEDLAPLAEDAIGGEDDGPALVAGRDNLEHQVGSSFVDREVA